MTWETLLRIGEIAFAAGGAVAYLKMKLGTLEAAVQRLEAQGAAQGLLLKKTRRSIHTLRRAWEKEGFRSGRPPGPTPGPAAG